MLTGKCDTLGVVARAGAHYATPTLLLVETLNEVVRATDLVRTDDLEVFALEIDRCLELFGQLAVKLERCLQHYVL
jgi:hypothetical protein